MASVLVGVSGWDYRDWDGPLYPRPRPRGFRALPLLARFLDFMEVNVTFYRVPDAGHAERWARETPDSFGFVLKAHQGWTHERRPVVGPELDRFRELVEVLHGAGRLYGVLAQFPPSVGDGESTRHSLLALRDAVAPTPLFAEFRQRGAYQRPMLEFLQEHEIEFVNVDLPDVRDMPRMSTINTGPLAYVRLHGRNASGWTQRVGRDERYNYRYSRAELEPLVDAVRELATRVPTVLVAANNHFRAQAAAAAVLVKSLHEGRSVPAPAQLIESAPELAGHAVPLAADPAP